MPRFEFKTPSSYTAYATVYFEVEADTEEEALKLLKEDPWEYFDFEEVNDIHHHGFEEDWVCTNPLAPPKPMKILEVPQWRDYNENINIK